MTQLVKAACPAFSKTWQSHVRVVHESALAVQAHWLAHGLTGEPGAGAGAGAGAGPGAGAGTGTGAGAGAGAGAPPPLTHVKVDSEQMRGVLQQKVPQIC